MIEALNGQEHPLWDFVQLAYDGKPWGWYFEVTSPEQYLAIYKRFFAEGRASAIIDFIESKEYKQYRPTLVNNVDHAHSKLASYLGVLCERAAERNEPMSPFHMAVKLDQTVTNVCLKVEKYGTIYLNQNGGWMTMGNHFTIINRVKQTFFPMWKKEDIKIIKWPGGVHFYAKIGTMDVVVDGKQKWDTHTEAQQHAEECFAQLTTNAT